MFVHARSPVWTSAVAERDRAQEEVLFERGPFLGCGLPVLTHVDSQDASSLDELLMGADHMVGKDCGVTTRGFQVEVAEHSRRDVQREPGNDQVGREQSSEVMWVEHEGPLSDSLAAAAVLSRMVRM